MCKQKKIYVLDRFEGELAILIADDGEQIKAPGLGGREGDVFELENGVFTLNAQEQGEREKRVRGKMDALFKKS